MRSGVVENIKSVDLKCNKVTWDKWLYSGDEIGKREIPFIEANKDNQLVMVVVITRKK